MHTLLLRLAGPMQSWGTQGQFNTRDTGQDPSKSGVIGLLCAALGRPRDASVDDLTALRLGVRVDREGIVEQDYQTASNIAQLGGGTKSTELTDRFYLADADFLIGLEGADLEFLAALESAVREPVWPLYLGRKAFVPALPVALPWRGDAPGGLRPNLDLVEALRREPRVGPDGAPIPREVDGARAGDRPRFVIEERNADRTERRFDQPMPIVPLSARRFLPRSVQTMFLTLDEGVNHDR